MKKTLAMIAVLLVAALLLSSCDSKENNGEKKLTANDIEGTWTVSDSSSKPAGLLTGLAGFLVSAKPDESAVLTFQNGKITAEWEAEDGKKTADLGAYEVSEGDVFINGFRTEATLEGKTLTLTQLAPPTEEGVTKREDNEATMTEVTEKTVMILERK